MTKSAKRKKERTTDFTKPKLKLGKGKQPATNAIDTSYKARSIALPQQSIATTKDASAPTTKRKLTLEDLLAHLKHYSAGIRKDALQGLHELLEEHRFLLEPNLLKLTNTCVRLISDEDSSVRKALHSFFAWLLPRIPREHLAPHAPTILLFTASAQTHIFPEIRIDAIRIIDLLLEFIPEYVVNGFMGAEPAGDQSSHGKKILDGYLGLLNVGARFNEDEGKGSGSSSHIVGQPSSLVMLSSVSKATVLRSFANFLLHATAQENSAKALTGYTSDAPIPVWYFSPSFSSPEAFHTFAQNLSLQRSPRNLHRHTCLWTPGRDFENDEEDFPGLFPLSDISEHLSAELCVQDLEHVLADVGRLISSDQSSDDSNLNEIRLTASLCRTVHPVLVSTFLDCAPSVFSPSQASPEAELELVLAILEISRCLYGRLLRDRNALRDTTHAAYDELRTLLAHMTVYFPFGESRMIAQDLKIESVFQQLNLIYCELFSLASSHDAHHSEEGSRIMSKRRKLNNTQPKAAKASAISMEKQTERVQEYVIRCLRGTAASGAGRDAYPLGQALTVQTYVALLPTLWWLLDRPVDEHCDYSEVLDAILQHATKTGSTSGMKLAATELVARLVLMQSESGYRGAFRIGYSSSEELQGVLRDWLLHLPKALWELGDKNLMASELIFLFLLRFLQRRSWLNSVEASNQVSFALRTRLQPFFMMQHATRGELRGPYTKLNKPSTDLHALEPKNEGQRSVPLAPLKELALDVAAALVSTLYNPGPARAPLKLFPRERRAGRAGDGSGLGFSSATVPESGLASGSGGPDAERESKEGLRRVVERAVAGTAEEAYWRRVSGM
ncbi:hypothetical protein DFH11DRAFT_1514092 [Phellopilus nigrolimitatus]|nr:hypothetical protein DFH11DRAFT_1514092 [Phellopilus nigrolimitatus]